MMRVIIAGSRTVTEHDVRKGLQQCSWAGFITAVVSGTARGADAFGEVWAEERGLQVLRFPADWKKHGRAAGPLRNKTMAENAEGLIALWDGQSRGTKSMIELAKKRGLRVTVLRTDSRTIEEYQAAGVLEELWAAAEERAGIKEFAGGLPRQEAERQAGAEAVAGRTG